MMPFFLKASKKIIVSLRFSILSIFVTLFIIAILSIIFLNYRQASKTLVYTANTLMQHVANQISEELANQIKQTEIFMDEATTQINQGTIDLEDMKDLASLTLSIANEFTLQQAFYWGGRRGSFVAAKYDFPEAVPNSVTTEIYNERVSPPLHQYIFRDVNGKILRTVTTNKIDYDPRQRPWYLEAKAAGKEIWTDVYVFAFNNYLGITLAKPFYESNGTFRGVLGMDISLYWLSWFIGLQKISNHAQTFIVSRDGKLIAFPKIYELEKHSQSLIDIHSLPSSWLSKAFDIYSSTHQTSFVYTYNNIAYLANFKDIPEFAKLGWVIGIVAPKDDFIGDIKRASVFDALLGWIILLVSIALVYSFVTAVVKPIKQLVQQTYKIKQFNLEDEKPIRSRIKEVSMLSDAISALRTGLKSFQQYVPAGLVRQLIETGENARIGGAKRPLVILFSDIKNFTTIAEKMNADKLMEHTCEYLDALSQIIVNEKGTIDKYIGDSIMSFWGAPLVVDHPAHRAARSALACVKRNDELNQMWEKQGLPAFWTRFGIHEGEAIVGNIGSSERLNYTAVGDAINYTDRLANVNKVYGTQILVSHTLYEAIKDDFILRKIDLVTVKGRAAASYIYELLAENSHELPFDIAAYQAHFELAFKAYQEQRWEEAVLEFKNCLTVYPGDSVVPIFIKRCKHFSHHSPLHWDGVWRMLEK